MSHAAHPATDGEVEDPLLGAVLQEKYRVVRKLGQGGMGTVYEGEHQLIGRRVAIKTLLPQYATNAEVVTRFRREAQAATSIGHEHIIEVTDMGSLDDGGTFLVLEYLEGCDLGDLIARDGPQPIGRIAHIVARMCAALSAAHAKGIVHRDLKPDNVYLIRRGDDPYFVKVLDFGISKIRDTEQFGGSAKMTQTGTPVGTPLFMAPEQARGQADADQRVDIYALGVILFLALTCRYPYEDESVAGLLVRILSDPVPDIRDLRPDLPPALADLIHRMLAKDRAARPPDCDAVARELHPFVDRTDARRGDVRPAARLVAGGTQPPARLQSISGTEATQLPAAMDPASGFEATMVSGTISRPPQIPQWRWRARILGGAAAALVALLAAGGAWLAFAPDSRVEAPASPSAPDPTAPSDVASPSPPTPPAGDDPPAMRDVDVRIHVQPADAELFIDGERVEAPFHQRIPASDRARRIEVRREGHSTETRELRFDEPTELTIALRRRAHGGEPSAHARTGERTTIAVADHDEPGSHEGTSAPPEPPADDAPRSGISGGARPDPSGRPSSSVVPELPTVRDPF